MDRLYALLAILLANLIAIGPTGMALAEHQARVTDNHETSSGGTGLQVIVPSSFISPPDNFGDYHCHAACDAIFGHPDPDPMFAGHGPAVFLPHDDPPGLPGPMMMLDGGADSVIQLSRDGNQRAGEPVSDRFGDSIMSDTFLLEPERLFTQLYTEARDESVAQSALFEGELLLSPEQRRTLQRQGWRQQNGLWMRDLDPRNPHAPQEAIDGIAEAGVLLEPNRLRPGDVIIFNSAPPEVARSVDEVVREDLLESGWSESQIDAYLAGDSYRAPPSNAGASATRIAARQPSLGAPRSSRLTQRGLESHALFESEGETYYMAFTYQLPLGAETDPDRELTLALSNAANLVVGERDASGRLLDQNGDAVSTPILMGLRGRQRAFIGQIDGEMLFLDEVAGLGRDEKLELIDGLRDASQQAVALFDQMQASRDETARIDRLRMEAALDEDFAQANSLLRDRDTASARYRQDRDAFFAFFQSIGRLSSLLLLHRDGEPLFRDFAELPETSSAPTTAADRIARDQVGIQLLSDYLVSGRNQLAERRRAAEGENDVNELARYAGPLFQSTGEAFIRFAGDSQLARNIDAPLGDWYQSYITQSGSDATQANLALGSSAALFALLGPVGLIISGALALVIVFGAGHDLGIAMLEEESTKQAAGIHGYQHVADAEKRVVERQLALGMEVVFGTLDISAILSSTQRAARAHARGEILPLRPEEMTIAQQQAHLDGLADEAVQTRLQELHEHAVRGEAASEGLDPLLAQLREMSPAEQAIVISQLDSVGRYRILRAMEWSERARVGSRLPRNQLEEYVDLDWRRTFGSTDGERVEIHDELVSDSQLLDADDALEGVMRPTTPVEQQVLLGNVDEIVARMRADRPAPAPDFASAIPPNDANALPGFNRYADTGAFDPPGVSGKVEASAGGIDTHGVTQNLETGASAVGFDRHGVTQDFNIAPEAIPGSDPNQAVQNRPPSLQHRQNEIDAARRGREFGQHGLPDQVAVIVVDSSGTRVTMLSPENFLRSGALPAFPDELLDDTVIPALGEFDEPPLEVLASGISDEAARGPVPAGLTRDQANVEVARSAANLRLHIHRGSIIVRDGRVISVWDEGRSIQPTLERPRRNPSTAPETVDFVPGETLDLTPEQIAADEARARELRAEMRVPTQPGTQAGEGPVSPDSFDRLVVGDSLGTAAPPGLGATQRMSREAAAGRGDTEILAADHAQGVSATDPPVEATVEPDDLDRVDIGDSLGTPAPPGLGATQRMRREAAAGRGDTEILAADRAQGLAPADEAVTPSAAGEDPMLEDPGSRSISDARTGAPPEMLGEMRALIVQSDAAHASVPALLPDHAATRSFAMRYALLGSRETRHSARP